MILNDERFQNKFDETNDPAATLDFAITATQEDLDMYLHHKHKRRRIVDDTQRSLDDIQTLINIIKKNQKETQQ